MMAGGERRARKAGADQLVGERLRSAQPRGGLETPVHCRPCQFEQARRADAQVAALSRQIDETTARLEAIRAAIQASRPASTLLSRSKLIL